MCLTDPNGTVWTASKNLQIIDSNFDRKEGYYPTAAVGMPNFLMRYGRVTENLQYCGGAESNTVVNEAHPRLFCQTPL